MDNSKINADYIELKEYINTKYVSKDDFNARMEKTEKEISEILINQNIVTTKLSFIEKLSLIIATATIGVLVAQIGSAIFK